MKNLRFSDLYKKGLFSRGDRSLSDMDRYRRLRRNLILTMVLIVMVPLSITASLSFYRYSKLLQEEASINARWSTESAQQTLEAYLDVLRAAIQVVSDSYTYDNLSSKENLNAVFRKLKTKHPGLVDLSVIGPDGIQTAYSGPYKLTGKNYQYSDWYNKALTKDFHISEVFMGFRRVPHFVIAISKKMKDDSGNWILRASVDTETLDRFLEPIHSQVVTDAFLVSHSGKLQSSSKHYGNVSQQFQMPDAFITKKITVTEGKRSDIAVLRTYVELKDTPWILVLEHQDFSLKATWLSFKTQMLLIFLICTILTIIIAVRIAHYLAANIRAADEARKFILAETEHTSKLASIGRLAAGVAHEINNPLAIINEKAGLMKDLLNLSDDFQYREKFMAQLDSLQNAVNRSHAITHRLLGFARRMETKRMPVPVNDVIADVLSFLHKEALHNNVQIKQNLDPALPNVMGDRGQMQQIFLNIVNNAIDAVGKGGVVNITSSVYDTDFIAVDIQDNGPGIPAEIQKHIFEPFFTTKLRNENPGSGLGLSITYGLVKKMGGEITVRSVLGSGATFSVILPIVTAPDSQYHA